MKNTRYLSLRAASDHYRSSLRQPDVRASGLQNDEIYPLALSRLARRSDWAPNSSSTSDFRAALSQRLETATNHDRISLHLSERILKAADYAKHITIERTMDVDSLFAFPDSLAICKEGLNLSYASPYNACITANQVVSPNGSLHPHKVRQFLLGTPGGLGDSRFQLHILFPSMEVTADEVYVPHNMQKCFFDDVLLPAIRRAAAVDVIQHHPRSWDEAYTRAQCRKEYLANPNNPSNSKHMHLQYFIEASYLDEIWQRVKNTCRSYNVLQFGPCFRNPLLYLSGHDIKLRCRGVSAAAVDRNFVERVESRLDMTYLKQSRYWIDLGTEDTPAYEDNHTGPGITLLFRGQCLAQWKTDFMAEPNPGCGTTPSGYRDESYSWSGLRDAGTGVVTPISARGRANYNIWHAKAYNIHKDVHYTPLREPAFGNPRLDAIGFTQEKLTSTTQGPSKLEQDHIVHAFVYCKNRVYTALRESRNQSFGARREFRIRRSELSRLSRDGSDIQLDNGPAGDPFAANSGHLPYWIIPTEEANEFMMWSANRLVYAIEHLAMQVNPLGNSIPPPNETRQYANSLMITTLLSLLRVVVSGGDVRRQSWLWKDELPRSERSNDGEVTNTRGLNIRAVFERYHALALPDIHIDWTALFFSEDLASRVRWPLNEIQKSMRGFQGDFRRAAEQDGPVRKWRGFIEEEMRHGNLDDITNATEVVLDGARRVAQQFYREFLDTLDTAARGEGAQSIKRPLSKYLPIAVQRLQQAPTFYDLEGAFWKFKLEHSIAADFRPCLAQTRPSRSANTTARLHRNQSGLWKHYVGYLYDWPEDSAVDARKRGANATRTWPAWIGKKKFSTLAMDFSRVWDNAGPVRHRGLFKSILVSRSYLNHWVVFNYDWDNLVTQSKASKAHLRSTQQHIRATHALLKIKFVVPALAKNTSANDMALKAELERNSPHRRDRWSDQTRKQFNRAREHIMQPILDGEYSLPVYNNVDHQGEGHRAWAMTNPAVMMVPGRNSLSTLENLN